MLTRDEALELIDRLPYITTIKATNDRIRAQFCRESLEKNDPILWIKVIKTCYLHREDCQKRGKIFPDEENELQSAAEHLFYSQLAAALGIKEEDILPFINQRIADEEF